jgi:molecular chaperone HtpG
VLDEHDLGLAMQRLLRQAGHEVPVSKPILEINPAHPLIQRLEREGEVAQATDLALMLFDQAQLLSGGGLEDPAAYVRRVNTLLTAG